MSTDKLTQQESVNLNQLSELAGVPMDFISKELFLDGEEVSMDLLRSKMLSLLDSTFAEKA